MYKILGYIGILIVVIICALAFFPQSQYFNKPIGFDGYDALIKDASDLEEKEEEEKLLVESESTVDTKTEKEMNIESKIDSLEFNRQVEDTINSFIYAMKSGNYDEAEKYLGIEQCSDVKRSVMYALRYNAEYTFFKNYLISYEVSINNIEKNENGAMANIKIRRYDINKLHKRLLEEQYESIEQYENATYEDILFQNEEYFRNEFVKSNVPIKDDNYNIILTKENEEWKILNDDSLTDVIINMEFQINKEYAS